MPESFVPVSDLPLAQTPYPRQYHEIGEWAKLHAQPHADATLRWAHGRALLCLAKDEWTVNHCGIHGGNTISYIYGCPRTPVDVDVFLRFISNNKTTKELKIETADHLKRVLTKHMPEVVDDYSDHRDKLRKLIKIDLVEDTARTPMPVGVWHLGQDHHLMAIDRFTNIIRKLYAIFRPIRKDMKRGSDLFDLAYLSRDLDLPRVTEIIYRRSRLLVRDKDQAEFPVALKHYNDALFKRKLKDTYTTLGQRYIRHKPRLLLFDEAWLTLGGLLNITCDDSRS